jgi:hypothetical protein
MQSYFSLQSNGLSRSSVNHIKRVLKYIYSETEGRISKDILLALSKKLWSGTYSFSQKDKTHIYIANFIKFLAQDRDDPLLASLLMYFRKPKRCREKKIMTTRIIVQEDVTGALKAINTSPTLWDVSKLRQSVFLLFLAYSGQRAETGSRLTVGQFRVALAQNPPVLKIEAKQDKLRMEHYCPLHPVLIPYLTKMIEGRKDTEKMFFICGLQSWLYRNPQPMKHTAGALNPMDLRKFFEQKSDELGFVDANKNYIMSHGVSSVNWRSYKAFLPEGVYMVYMRHWGDVNLLSRP